VPIKNQDPLVPSPSRPALAYNRTICPSALPCDSCTFRNTPEHDKLGPASAAALEPHTKQFAMDRLTRVLSCVLLAILPLTAALKFDLHPVSTHDSAKYERCVRNFVAKEQLVVVTAILDGYRGDGQRVDMHVRCLYLHYSQPSTAAPQQETHASIPCL
jgi:hypothetical protein